MSESHVNQGRRSFIKKVAYTAPVIATLNVMPSIASAGSRHKDDAHHHKYPRKHGKRDHHRSKPRFAKRKAARKAKAKRIIAKLHKKGHKSRGKA